MYKWLRRLFTISNDEHDSIEDIKVEPAKPLSLVKIETPAPQTEFAMSRMQREALYADFANWLFENNDPDLFANETEKKILEAIDKIVKSKQSGSKLVRRMPGVIPPLLQSLRTEDYSGAELARKISHDVVLVEAVIRIANSSFYNSNQSVTSIEHAVLILGQEGLRQLITNVAFKPIIDFKSKHFTKMIAPKVWDQSEKCAIAVRLLAENEDVDPFEAFLAGLVQNVGLIVSLHVVDQVFDEKHSLGSGEFCTSLMSYAQALSCSIATEWRFPANVIKAIEGQGITGNDADISPIGKILRRGDLLSKLQILTTQNKLSESSINFVDTLSANDIKCINALNAVPPQESL